MLEEQQRLTVLNMDDEDDENGAGKQLPHQSDKGQCNPESHQSETAEKLSPDERMMRRLALRGIHCATVPPRADLISHFRKYPQKFAPVLEWLRKDDTLLFEVPEKQPHAVLNIDDGGGSSAKDEPPIELLIDMDLVSRTSMNFYNRRTRIIEDEDIGWTIIVFDYRQSEADAFLEPIVQHPHLIFHDVDGQCIHWKHLQDLVRWKMWDEIKHPMVLNFINERLTDFAIFYFLYLAMFVWFLILLSSNIFSKNIFKDILISLFVGLFLIVMILKLKATRCAVFREDGNKFRKFGFIIGYAFHILTFAATLAHVWLPYIFEYDGWALPFLAVLSAWANFLYILRKGPTGIYIVMMARLLKSFGHIATIWIPTMFAFSFAFQVILRDSGIEPWNSANQHQNATTIETIFVILQAFTKTSAMMLGEVEADTILGTGQWVPSILLLIFEITTVILLMNLMVSIAVGDVNDLRKESNSGCLGIKLNFAIESLQLAEAIPIPFFSKIRAHSTNNVLVFDEDGVYYATFDEGLVEKLFDEPRDFTTSILDNNENPPTVKHCPCCQGAPKKRKGWGRKRRTFNDDHGCTKVFGQDTGILVCKDIEFEDYFHLKDETSFFRKAKKWMIGLDWHTYVDMDQIISDAAN